MATDNFNRADENPLQAPWTRAGGGSEYLYILSQVCRRGGSSSDQYWYYSGAASSADQYSEAKISQKPTGNDWGPAVRVQSGAVSGYMFDSFSNDRQIAKHTNGTYSRLAGSGSDATVVGDVERLEISGSTLTAKVNGGTLFSVTDTSFSTGQPGVFWYENTGAIDDWAGGDLTTAKSDTDGSGTTTETASVAQTATDVNSTTTESTAFGNVQQVGTTINIQNSANSGSQSITVPADAQIAVIATRGFNTDTAFVDTPDATPSIGAQSSTKQVFYVDAGDGNQIGMWTLLNPPTGTQTFAWNWKGSAAWGDGGDIYISFYKNIDTATPVGSKGGQGVPSTANAATASSGSLTVAKGDAVVAVGYFYDSGAAGNLVSHASWSGITAVIGPALYFNSVGSYAQHWPAPGTVTDSASQTAAGFNCWVTAGFMVLKVNTGSGTSKSDTDVNSTTTEVGTVAAQPSSTEASGTTTETASVARISTTTDVNSTTTEAQQLSQISADVNGTLTEAQSLVVTALSSADVNSATTEAQRQAQTTSDTNSTTTENGSTGAQSKNDTDTNGTTTEAQSEISQLSSTDVNSATTEAQALKNYGTDTNSTTTETETYRYNLAAQTETNSTTTEFATTGTTKQSSDTNSTTTETGSARVFLTNADVNSTVTEILSQRQTTTETNSTTTEAGQVAVPVSSSDVNGTVTDVAGAPRVYLNYTDSGGDTETASARGAALGVDTATSTETAAPGASCGSTDTGSGADLGTVAIHFTVIELGTSSELATATVAAGIYAGEIRWILAASQEEVSLASGKLDSPALLGAGNFSN